MSLSQTISSLKYNKSIFEKLDLVKIDHETSKFAEDHETTNFAEDHEVEILVFKPCMLVEVCYSLSYTFKSPKRCLNITR